MNKHFFCVIIVSAILFFNLDYKLPVIKPDRSQALRYTKYHPNEYVEKHNQ